MTQLSDVRLRDYLQAIAQHWVLIVVVALGTMGIGFLMSSLSDPVYVGEAEVQVRSEASVSPFGEDNADVQTRTLDLVTETELLKSTTMKAAVVDYLGPDAEPFDDVKPRTEPYSEIITLTVTSPTPTGAADAANAYAQLFVEQRLEEATSSLRTQAAALRRQSDAAAGELGELEALIAASPTGASQAQQTAQSTLAAEVLEYSRAADQLEVEASLRADATRIVTPAVLENDPVSPQPMRSATVALVLGLLAGIGLAIIREAQLDRLRTTEELASIEPDTTVLAAVPHVEGRDLDAAGAELPRGAVEGINYLRTSLRFRGASSVVTTSAVANEGKTTVAVQLALAMAEAGDRVVLVDADLRRPTVHQRLDLDGSVGLSSVLSGAADLADAVQYVGPSLAVLPAGPPATNANELLGAAECTKVLRALREQCDMLIVDAPPVLLVADPLLVAEAVGGVVLVARVGVVKRRELRAALRRLREARLPLVGLVANDLRHGSAYDSYGPLEEKPEKAESRRARRVGSTG